MIKLTKLNREHITLNAIFIERVESTPDTVITLINGKKIIVLESEEEVSNQVAIFYKKISLIHAMVEEQRDV
jgi:flagellar protein FlbD